VLWDRGQRGDNGLDQVFEPIQRCRRQSRDDAGLIGQEVCGHQPVVERTTHPLNSFDDPILALQLGDANSFFGLPYLVTVDCCPPAARRLARQVLYTTHVQHATCEVLFYRLSIFLCERECCRDGYRITDHA
jgi:hypothetical protein